MKKLFFTFFITLAYFSKSQVILNEEFVNPFNPTTAGWYLQNESYSVTANTTTWYQGDPTNYFPAYSGQPSDYFCADYFGTDPGAVGTISNWLITPTVTIYNGAVLQFVTRTENTGSVNVYPDRLQIRMSTAGTTSVIPTGTASVGTFSNLLFDINPSLNTSTVGTVSNGSIVNGYPNSWTVYSITISGITGTMTGRFAFRYFVTGGGAPGNNSLYVGVDAVKYTLPCGATVPNYTVCTGNSVTLAAVGGLASTTYSWNNSSTNPSIVVTPTSTTVYTLTTFNGNTQCGQGITSTVTIGPGLSVSVAASQNSFCAGQTITVTAISGASTYSWSTGATTSSIIVTPSANIVYSVGVANANLTCFGGATVSIVVKASPQLTITKTPNPTCAGDTVNILLSGANTYTFLGSSQNPLAIPVPTTPGSYPYQILAQNANGCTIAKYDTVKVYPYSVISASVSSSVLCSGNTITLNVTGGSTYSWTGAMTSTASSFTYSSTTIGPKSFSVASTNSFGCKSQTVVNVFVSGYPLITSTLSPTNICTNDVGTINVSGGTSYTWVATNSIVASSYTVSSASSGVQNYTVTGRNNYGCKTTTVVNVTFNDCTRLKNNSLETTVIVYPNPFSDQICISNFNGKVEIYNSLGQLVFSKNVLSQEKIKTSEFSRGVYFIRATSLDNETSGLLKIIK